MEALFTHFIPTLEKTTVFGMFQASYTKSTQTIITDTSLIPKRFWLVEKIPAKTITKYPKDEIAKAIDSGEEVPGAYREKIYTLKIK